MPVRGTPEQLAVSPPITVDLLPAELNLLIYSGDTLQIHFLFTDSADVAVDVSGTWTAQVRISVADATPVAVFDVDESQAAQGIIIITLSSDQTQALPASAVWDIQQLITPDTIRTTHRGTLTVTEDVTR
jgi:hypothetical protein